MELVGLMIWLLSNTNPQEKDAPEGPAFLLGYLATRDQSRLAAHRFEFKPGATSIITQADYKRPSGRRHGLQDQKENQFTGTLRAVVNMEPSF